ncbi:hypothetical protein PV08_01325 [Exophiala spinifera]|uniref:CYTH domain-containing protein n=1 Tax=Exophiala spinifera TaxID=91928 RepID=A0A0D2A7J0_9EURO|nr:uncharacterized protein PV08_01325 [Exophiala spinifera]KIW20747.1 hypothetical protein PV08_01325 [Exophiala spinifera]
MVSSLVPDFEVKVLLKPSEVLDSENKAKADVLSAFGFTSRAKKMNVQFLDTRNREFYNNGWNLRIRKTEDDDKYELTYKKRYDISTGFSTTAEGHIKETLEVARQEGLDSSTGFEAQVDIGYQKQTLSISRDKEVPTGQAGTDLPPLEASRKLLADGAPEKFNNWKGANWGTQRLADSIVYGPVLAERFKVKWQGLRLFLEVWPIRKSKTDASLEYIVEASFKADTLQEAVEGRDKLIKVLQDDSIGRDWFLPGDSLRTKLIMERYGEVN